MEKIEKFVPRLLATGYKTSLLEEERIHPWGSPESKMRSLDNSATRLSNLSAVLRSSVRTRLKVSALLTRPELPHFLGVVDWQDILKVLLGTGNNVG